MRHALNWTRLGAVVLVATTAQGADAPVLEIEVFLTRHSEEWVTAFDHPQVACLLESFVPPDRITALRDVMIGLQGKQWLDTRDQAGGFLFEGFLSGAACQRAVLWLHPDGRIFGGDVPCDGRLIAFTNDRGLRGYPPPAVLEWMADGGRWGGTAESIEWACAVPAVRVPASCLLRAARTAAEDFSTRLDGRACDSKVQFSSPFAIVQPASGATAPMSRPGGTCMTSGAPRRRPYLVAGDLVAVDFWRDSCRCARFDGAGGTTTGWMSHADLRSFDAKLPTDTPWNAQHLATLEHFVEGLPASPGFVGDWASDCASLSISRREDGTLRLLASGGISDGNPQIDVPLKSKDRMAWIDLDGPATEDADDACRLVILRFNNALAVVENGACGDRYCSYNGHYLPVRKPKLR